MGSVHIYCLENWLHVKNIQRCEVCNDEYRIQKILKYGRLRSLLPYARRHKSTIMNNLLCIIILFMPTLFANIVIIHILKKLKCENFNSFIKVYFSLVWLFLHYFFLVECFYEIYDLYHSWRTWRMSVFTIRVN